MKQFSTIELRSLLQICSCYVIPAESCTVSETGSIASAQASLVSGSAAADDITDALQSASVDVMWAIEASLPAAVAAQCRAQDPAIDSPAWLAITVDRGALHTNYWVPVDEDEQFAW